MANRFSLAGAGVLVFALATANGFAGDTTPQPGSAGDPKAAPGLAADTLRRYRPKAVAVPHQLLKARGRGRNIVGTVTFDLDPSRFGTPIGNATQICSRVQVTARKYVPTEEWYFDASFQIVRSATGKPVNPKDYTAGCTYSLVRLPAEVALHVEASYEPPSAWAPPCTGTLAQVSTLEVMTVTFPDEHITVEPLDLVLDFKDCGEIG